MENEVKMNPLECDRHKGIEDKVDGIKDTLTDIKVALATLQAAVNDQPDKTELAVKKGIEEARKNGALPDNGGKKPSTSVFMLAMGVISFLVHELVQLVNTFMPHVAQAADAATKIPK